MTKVSDFLDILTHGRRLQGAVKPLSLEELNEVADKLATIIENRKSKEAERIAAEKEKQEKIEAIRKQMIEAGVDLDDLQDSDAGKKSKRAGQKRPVKYRMTDQDGNEHTWTGIGRMPKVYSQALANGKDIEQFRV